MAMSANTLSGEVNTVHSRWAAVRRGVEPGLADASTGAGS